MLIDLQGLTPEQAEMVTYSLVEITQGQMDFIQKNLVTKDQQVSVVHIISVEMTLYR